MTASVVNRKKLAGLYLAIEDVKEKSFSPRTNCKGEIEATFADLRSEFYSVLSPSQLNDLEEAENHYNEYYDNFDNNSDEENDKLLIKAEDILNRIAPYLTEAEAEKWL